MPELRQMPGFVGAYLSQRALNGKIEYLVLTKWHSMDAIRRFAGSDIGKAVLEPGAIAALVDFDARVNHYEVVEASPCAERFYSQRRMRERYPR